MAVLQEKVSAEEWGGGGGDYALVDGGFPIEVFIEVPEHLHNNKLQCTASVKMKGAVKREDHSALNDVCSLHAI